MTRSGLALAALCAILVVGTADAKKKQPAPPSKAVISRLMTELYIGDDATRYPDYKYKLTVTKLVRGKPRAGDPVYEGTPPNRKTTVFPTRVTMVYVRCSPDGDVIRQDIVDDQLFFKDEYKTWTHHLVRQSRTPTSQSHVAGPCPV